MSLKRTFLALVACIAIPSTASGQVQEAASNFEIPSFETKYLDVHGQDLFSLNDAGAMNINLGSNFWMASQTPEQTWNVSNGLEINMSKADSDADMGKVIGNVLRADYQKFFGGSRGLSVITGLDLTFGMIDDAKALNAGLVVGVGYGRKFNARTVAQAAAMCAASGKTCTAADLNKIADIIGKNSAGYYAAQFKADGPVEFNKELSAATGGEAAKNAQVLGSNIYNIGNRHVGWEANATLNIASGDHLAEGDDASGMSMHIAATGGYGMLLDDNSGINAGVSFLMGMGQEYAGGTALADAHPGDGNMAVALDLGYNLDHSSSWNTTADFNFNMNLPKEGDATNSWGLDIASNYALTTEALAGISIHAGSAVAAPAAVADPITGVVDPAAPVADGGSDLAWNVQAHFTYFIF